MGHPQRRRGDGLTFWHCGSIGGHVQRLTGGRVLADGARAVPDADAPLAVVGAGQVELPELALQVAGIGDVHGAVLVDVDQARRRQAVGLRQGGVGDDAQQGAITIEVLDQQDRAFVEAVCAVSHDHSPALIVELHDLLAASGADAIDHGRGMDVPDILVTCEGAR
ncbi:hypothetical protein D9M68_784610 [compost metagenome]